MEWKRVKKLESIDEISNFEAKYQITFPITFVEIVKDFNGARPINNIFDTSHEKGKVADRLLSFNHQDLDNIWQTYDALKNRLPVNTVPFMMDPFGNYICFYIDSLDPEIEVVYWQHEKTEDNIQHIAKDFNEFLTKLYII